MERRSIDDIISTNEEYTDQAHWVVNALAWPQGHPSLWTKPILANWAHSSIGNKLCGIRPQRPWQLPLKVVRGCGILVLPPILGPINNMQVPNFLCVNISPREQFICMCPWYKSKVPDHVVLSILLIDLVHLDCDLLVLIHCEDASNLPLIILLTYLEDVPFMYFIVFLKLNDLVQIWWILNLACGLWWCMDIIFCGEHRKWQKILSLF